MSNDAPANCFQISGRSECRYMGAHQGREIDQHAEQEYATASQPRRYKAVPVKAARPANNRLPDYIPHAQIGKSPSTALIPDNTQPSPVSQR